MYLERVGEGFSSRLRAEKTVAVDKPWWLKRVKLGVKVKLRQKT